MAHLVNIWECSLMEISIIIPTFNNAVMLATTLMAFEGVTFPNNVELIVVDNNSSDFTAEIIKSFSDRLPIRYEFERKQGISAAKNKGISSAKGKLLLFTDDDVRPCPEWIQVYLAAYRQNKEKLFWGGAIVSEFEGAEPDEALLQLAPPSVKGLDLGVTQRRLDSNEWFVGANLALTAESLEEVGGFDTALGLDPTTGKVLVGEESDLQRRLKSSGYYAEYLPSASIRHVVPSSKCTLDHIASRAEACGRYMKAMSPEMVGRKTLRGVPLWRYRKCIERRVSAWIKRIFGQNWYPDYISYRADLGFIKGPLIKKDS